MNRIAGKMASGLGAQAGSSLRCCLLAGTMLACLYPWGAAAQTAPGVVLDTVEVDTQRSDEATTEGKNTYTAPVVTVGSKDAQPVRQIPQSVTVVTRRRLDDQNLTQLDEAMRQTTGMVVLQNDAGRSSIMSRGYEIGDVQVDGLPAPVSSIMGTQPDLFIFDRVEVLKGPMGVFSGGSSDGNTAGPGASVNLVRKRPADHFQAYLNGSYGSWDNGRGEADFSGPLNAAKTVRGRLIGVFHDRDTFVDYNRNKVMVGYGALDFDLTPNTTFSVAAWRQERDILPFNGLPAFRAGGVPGGQAYLGDFDRSTFVGAAWNRFDNWSNEYMAELEYRLDGGGHVKAGVRFVDRFVDYKYTNAASNTFVNPATGNFSGMSLVSSKWWERSLSADAHISKPFTMFGQTQNNITLGVNYRQHEVTQFSPPNTIIPGAHNIYNFNPSSVPEPADNFTNRTRNEPVQYGAYGQLRLKPVQPISVILGGRLSKYELTGTNLVTGVVTNQLEIDRFSPYAGLVVDMTRNVSAYVSYSDIFLPQTQTDASGRVLDPRVGKQYEAGVKASFLDGALNASAAIFLIRDTNRAMSDGMGSFVAAGEVEVHGFELELSGSPLPGWDIYAGYTNSTTRFLSGGTGDFRTFWPDHVFNLWTKYTFQNGPWRNFHVAGGAKYVSSFYSGTGTNRLEENGYVVVDAQLGYKFNENFSAAFTVTNLFDEVYYARVGSAALFNFYGEPRAYNFKLSSKW